MNDQAGMLKLRLVDVYQKPINEPVDILLGHQVLSHNPVMRGVNAAKKIAVRNLYASPQGLYRVSVDPPSYLPVSEFINVASGPRGTERELVFPVDPKKVSQVNFPAYESLPEQLKKVLETSNNVLGYPGRRTDAVMNPDPETMVVPSS